MVHTKQIPVLGLDEFRSEHSITRDFQFHAIKGERIIEHPHTHDFYVLLLVEKGSGVHTIDFESFQIRQRQIHILLPEQVHQWNLGKTTSALQLMLSKEIFSVIHTTANLKTLLFQAEPVLSLSRKEFEEIRHEFDCIQQELLVVQPVWPVLHARTNLLIQLICRVAQINRKGLRPQSLNPMVTNFQLLLDGNFLLEKTVAFYAASLFISPNYLNILCRRQLNCSAQELIHNRVLLEAKRLIHTSDKSIKEIAYTLGFEDPAYFSNFFKSKTGLTPRQFRAQL